MITKKTNNSKTVICITKERHVGLRRAGLIRKRKIEEARSEVRNRVRAY